MAHGPHHDAFVPAQHDAPDAWHLHTADEGQAQPEHARIADPRLITIAFILLVASLVVVVGLLIVYFNSYATKELARKTERLDTAQHSAYRGGAELELRTAGPLDPETKSVRLPIDRAIDRVVRSYEEKRASAR
ncbi:MAG: hypothetical protein FJ255_12045 [Phycisphaerae bacterium]|nr:hypothetical protein [Phycisphaerae bacterium]